MGKWREFLKWFDWYKRIAVCYGHGSYSNNSNTPTWMTADCWELGNQIQTRSDKFRLVRLSITLIWRATRRGKQQHDFSTSISDSEKKKCEIKQSKSISTDRTSTCWFFASPSILGLKAGLYPVIKKPFIIDFNHEFLAKILPHLSSLPHFWEWVFQSRFVKQP